MAIKGLTDRGLDFPQIGNIRKGAPKDANQNRPGFDLKYFRVEFDGKEDATAKKFLDLYGPQPTEIDIVLPFNEIERVWDPYCEAYTAGRMVARSDGETFSYLVSLATGQLLVKDGINVETGQPEPHREIIGKAGKSDIKCRPVGRLRVIIPNLQRAAYLVVHTTSVIDIRNISNQLNAVRALNGGQIVGVPMILRRRPVKVSVPKPDGSHARLEKWMLSIEADPKWVALKLGQIGRLALPEPSHELMPGVEETETEEEHGPWIDDGEDEAETGEISDGLYTEPEEVKPEPKPQPTAEQHKDFWPADASISFSSALLVKTNEGKFYMDLTDAELTDKAVKLKEMIDNNGMTREVKDRVLYALDTIKFIQIARTAFANQ